MFQCVVLHVCSVFHVGLSCLTPKRGAQPRARLCLLGFVFGSGVNRGWGSGFINEFENSAKGIIFVKK